MPSQKPSQPKTLWGGRFGKTPMGEAMQQLNASIAIDKRLYAFDIQVSTAHARMLAAQKLITAAECRKIVRGLAQIEQEIAGGRMKFDKKLEDIHTHIDARLAQLIGEAAHKLGTARSRNDQIVTDFKLYLRANLQELRQAVRALQLTLARRAEQHAATLMPGFTHLQIAQPISYGHYLLAYVEMLARDEARLADAQARLDASPLGAGALAGTSLPIDPAHTAKALGFASVAANSLDAVASRDFVLEAMAAAAICSSHLSRLAEEVILFASQPFGFYDLPDALSTGSSLMPQKRNPDAAELVRAQSGRLLGSFTALFAIIKALPLAYAKDLQNDKQLCFEALDELALGLQIMDALMPSLKLNTERMRELASRGESTATDLAEHLVREGVAFRRAHELVGKLVRLAESQDCQISDLPLDAIRKVAPQLNAKVYRTLAPRTALEARRSVGGTAPARVRASARRWQKSLRASARRWQKSLRATKPRATSTRAKKSRAKTSRAKSAPKK